MKIGSSDCESGIDNRLEILCYLDIVQLELPESVLIIARQLAEFCAAKCYGKFVIHVEAGKIPRAEITQSIHLEQYPQSH